MRPDPSYKDSGVPWLGEIPAHWDVKRLKFVADFCGGGTPAKENPEFWNGDIPWVSPKDMKTETIQDTEDHITDEAVRVSATRMIEPGAVIIVVRSGILKHSIPVAINVRSVALNQDMKAIGVKTDLQSGYLAYLIRGHQSALLSEWRKQGATVESIEHELLTNTPMPLPPLPEQRAIAAFLDCETVRIDSLIAKKERLIALFQEKRAGLISHAVTKGLDGDPPLKDSGVEWLGEVPAHWAVAPVYARYQVQLGKMLDSERITGEHLAHYLRNVDVQWDRINVENLPEMDFAASDRKRFSLRKGDLLVCEGGEVGRAAVWRGELDECYYQKAIHRLRPFSSDDFPRFMFYVLFSAAKRGVFVAEGNPNTIDHLTAEKLRGHRFGFPPTLEQRAIAAYLDRETAKIDAIIGKTRAHIGLLRERRTSLISAAVTGKIDVRELVTTDSRVEATDRTLALSLPGD